MASKGTGWKKWQSVDRYARQLEDVYGIALEMAFTPLPGQEGTLFSTLTITGTWKDSTRSGEEPITYSTRVVRDNDEAFLANMLRALTDYTYVVLNAYIEVL